MLSAIGGIFWQGIHVANNWRREPKFDDDGELIVNALVALNAEEVAGDSE